MEDKDEKCPRKWNEKKKERMGKKKNYRLNHGCFEKIEYLSRKEERVGLNILIMVNFEYLVDYFTEGKQILFL